MSKLAKSMPLVNVHDQVDGGIQVETHMQEPLVTKTVSRRKRLGFQALTLMTDLELALVRLEQLEQSATASLQDHPPVEVQEAKRLQNSLSTLVGLHDENGRTVQSYVTEVGLTALFPKAAAYLHVEQPPPLDDQNERSTIRDHFTRMSILHQLVAMALQLKDGLRLPNHRYIAHQVALLYQCLSKAGPHFDKYRSRVENEFDTVKAQCSETKLDGPPLLSRDVHERIAELVDDVVTEVLFQREVLHHVSRTLAGFVQAVSG